MNQFNVKNYTSTVAPARTAERIEAFLAAAGATHIAKRYDGGKIVGIDFAVTINDEAQTQLAFRLPVDVAAMTAYMRKQRKSYLNHAQTKNLQEQAERTAWKLMQDWVEAQLSLVVTNQAEVAQVFMPYLLSGEQTFYKAVKARGLAQLAAPRGNE
jgi:hypothetical protein